jgi:Flp pilus assembly pilin Flp
VKAYRKGQSTLEIGVLIACICAAMIAMQFYIKRSVAGRFRQGADEIGQQFDYYNTSQSVNTTVTTDSIITSRMTTNPALGLDAHGYRIFSIEYAVNQQQNVTKRGWENVTK